MHAICPVQFTGVHVTTPTYKNAKQMPSRSKIIFIVADVLVSVLNAAVSVAMWYHCKS